MQGCTEKVAFDLDGVRSRVGSVQGSMRRGEHASGRFQARLDEVVMEDVPALLDEVDRLRKMESKMELDLASNYKMLVTLREDHRRCFAVGRDMAANQISEHIGRLTVENKVLEKVLRDAR